MWTPYDWQINALEDDIRVIDQTASSLASVDGAINTLDDHLSNLGTHISAGFMVSCSTAGMTQGADGSLAASRTALARNRADMERELDSLRGKQSNYIARIERERREYQRRLQQQRQQAGSQGWRY